MNAPSVVRPSSLWRPAGRGIIVTLAVGLAILALGRGVNLSAREVYREMQTRRLEEDAQWVAQCLERQMNTLALQRETVWPLTTMRAELHTLTRQRYHQLLSVNGDGHLLMASHTLPASVLAQAQVQFPREVQPPLFGSHYQTTQPFAPHRRMLTRALSSETGLTGWNLAVLVPDGGLLSLLMAYRWPVTINLDVLFTGALLAVKQAVHARRRC